MTDLDVLRATFGTLADFSNYFLVLGAFCCGLSIWVGLRRGGLL